MASKIILKKSAVPGKSPVAADLTFGELAINYADGFLYYKKTDETVNRVKSFGENDNITVNSITTNIVYTGNSSLTSASVDLNATTNNQVIDNITTVTFESAEYTIQVKHPTLGKQISKLNVLYDSTDVDSIEYGIVFTQVKLVDFTIVFSGSTISVIAQPHVGDCNVKYVRTLIN